MIAAETYAVAVNFNARYRMPADMVGESKIGIANNGESGSDVEKSNMEGRVLDGAEVVQIEKQQEAQVSH